MSLVWDPSGKHRGRLISVENEKHMVVGQNLKTRGVTDIRSLYKNEN